MPFTLAHPAIILPLSKNKRFSTTALIAGSMVPDFEFFFQLREIDNIGHHWYGILLFDFPMAMICCFLFHNLLRNSLIINLPVYLRSRFIDVSFFDWNTYTRTNKWKITFSLIIGICSHILWDGFTHYDGIFVEALPVLTAKTGIVGIDIPVYFLLQLVFSIIGLLAVTYAIICLPQQQATSGEEKNDRYWPSFGLTLSLILCIRLTGWPHYNSFWGVFMAVMGGICYTWIITSVLFKHFSSKKIFL
jgi:hypothetical protein